MFDEPVEDESKINQSRIYELSCKLSSYEPFNYSDFLDIPNSTEEKIKELHKKHIEKRGNK